MTIPETPETPETPLNLPARLLLLHKQATSGRVRFLSFGDSVLAFAPLPSVAALRPENTRHRTLIHPSSVLNHAAETLGLSNDNLAADADFAAWVDTPSGDIPILLAHFTSIDPPFAAAAALGAKFISLTEIRHLPPVERELLRRAYEHVLG